MLKEKLPVIPTACSDIEDVIYEDMKASAVKANKNFDPNDLVLFLETRKTMTRQANLEGAKVIKDKTTAPMFLLQKQKELVLSFFDSQAVNLNFLDFNVPVLIDKNYFTKLDVFAQHKTTEKFFLFSFTFYDLFSLAGQFYANIQNTEINAVTMELNFARQSIKNNAKLDGANLAIINFSPSNQTFSVVKCQTIDDETLNKYVQSKTAVMPTVTVAAPIIASPSLANSVTDIFGNSF